MAISPNYPRLSSALILLTLSGCAGTSSESSSSEAQTSSAAATSSIMVSSSSEVVTSSVPTISSSAASSENTFELTSNSLLNGDPLPPQHTCEGGRIGDGISPELLWNEGPAGTQSYAMVFKDKTLVDKGDTQYGYHWMIWNIPTSINRLPEGLAGGANPAAMNGATQFSSQNNAYFGPCPNYLPNTDETHTYQFTLYALPSAMTAYGTDFVSAVASFERDALESTTFTVTSNAHGSF